MDAINDGLREFAKAAHGLLKTGYVDVTPKFTTDTRFAFKLTTLGTAKTVNLSSASEDVSGGAVATVLQTTIQAATTAWSAVSVSWGATSWDFSIKAPSASGITVSSPPDTDKTDIDAVDLLFGGGGSTSATIWTSGTPEDCTVEASLPANCLDVDGVDWDNRGLFRTSLEKVMSPEYFGRPRDYYIRGSYIRFYPSPRRQELCRVYYKKHPTLFVDAATQASVSVSGIPEAYIMAPIFYAASMVADENFERAVSDRLMARFNRQVTQYNITEANKNPSKEAVRDPNRREIFVKFSD
jgi:hypothetical protein